MEIWEDSGPNEPDPGGWRGAGQCPSCGTDRLVETTSRDRHLRRPMAKMGSLPGRKSMGDGAGGLLSGRRCLVLLSLGSSGFSGLSLQRGRHGGYLRRPLVVVLGLSPLERARPDLEGKGLWAHQLARQPRRGCQGMLVVPRRNADVELDAVAPPLPAGFVPM